jgi:hypothetical protein
VQLLFSLTHGGERGLKSDLLARRLPLTAVGMPLDVVPLAGGFHHVIYTIYRRLLTLAAADGLGADSWIIPHRWPSSPARRLECKIAITDEPAAVVASMPRMPKRKSGLKVMQRVPPQLEIER